MPLIKLSIPQLLLEETRVRFLAEVSRLMAVCTGKPEAYVMVVCEVQSMMMAGTIGNAAYADIRGIGLVGEPITKLAKEMSVLLERWLGVPADRIYLNFTDVPANRWGWNHETFG